MVRRFLQYISQEISGLHEAAYLLGFFALLSQLLGFLRDRLLAGEFGAGELLDIYYAAFRVPDFIFIWGASMVSLSVLIPFLSRRISEGKEAARRLLDDIFTCFFLFILAVSLGALYVAPQLTLFLFPGFDAEAQSMTILLMRIMLLQPIFLGISNLFASITQLERRFFIYALSPLLYNAGIIVGVVYLYPRLGMAGLAWGVVLGAVLHLLVQLPVIAQSGLIPRFTLSISWRDMREVALVSLPRTFALSAQNLAVLVLVSLGSLLGVGSIAVFHLSWNLQSMPLAIVGASYSLAAFPTLSLLWSGGNREKFIALLSTSLRHILFWSLPALALFVVLRAQIVRTVLGSGAFDWGDTRLTAASLALFALSIVAQSIILLFTRGYYAAGKTKVPFLVGSLSAVSIIFFAFLFSKLFVAIPIFRFFIETLFRVSDLPGTTVLILPLSYSLGVIGAAIVSWAVFTRQFASFEPRVVRTFWQCFASAVIIGATSYGLLNVFDGVFNLHTTLGVFLQGLFSGMGGIAAGICVLFLLGNLEIREIWRTLHQKIWKAKIVPDQTETTF
ncbi:MAG: lipid II flippase MurJ [bacterium]|nr:lipid II flippase MurJ [bacterium]